MLKILVLNIIRFYQKTLSFDHGIVGKVFGERFCRFYPSCSEYTYQAIDKYGVVKGSLLGLRRVIKCHPWNDGGYDPLV